MGGILCTLPVTLVANDRGSDQTYVSDKMKKLIVLAMCLAVVAACFPGGWDFAEQKHKSILDDDAKTKKDPSTESHDEDIHVHDISENDAGESIEVQKLMKKEEDLTEDEVGEDIGNLMQEVEVQLNTLTDEQMSKLQALLKEHYAGNIIERDNMLDSLVKGDEAIEKLVDLIKLLEEKGAKINLLDDTDDENDDGEDSEANGETNENVIGNEDVEEDSTT